MSSTPAKRATAAFAALVVALLVLCSSVLAADLSIDDIIAKAKARFDGTTTLSVTVSAQFSDPSTDKATKMSMKIQADQTAGLSRVVFTAPSAFKDQVMIVDQKNKVMKMYMPVTNQVMVSRITASSATSAASGMGMGGLGSMGSDFLTQMSLPDQSTHDFKLLGTEKLQGQVAYKITVREKPAKGKADAKAASQTIWLTQSDLSPLRIEMVGADGKTTGVIDLKDLKVGLKLDPKKLVFVPRDAEVVQG